MNFLAHYYFDHKPNKVYYNLGLILPDLVRNFVKGTKLDLEKDQQSGNANSLKNGCIKHVASDKLFHNWEGFLDSMDRIINMIRQSEHDFKKDWFVAHILSELILDKVLLEIEPNLAKRIYIDYRQVETLDLHKFLGTQNFSKFDEFDRGFQQFLDKEYLQSYENNENIIYALGKICNKMKLSAFSDQQKSLLSDIIKIEGALLKKEVPELKELLK